MPITKMPKIDDKNEVKYVVCSAEDITELQEVSETLQKSEVKFRAYMEKAPLGIFVADNTGHYIEVNRAACQMSGYTEEELLNLTILDFLAPEFLDEGMKTFAKLQAEGHVEDDIMVRKKNGETFWINLVAITIDSNRVISFCQDITRRKDAQDALSYQLQFEKTVSDISTFFVGLPSEQLQYHMLMQDT